MTEQLSEKNFGLVIAYILPGFVALWGASSFSPTIASWMTPSQQAAPTVAGFLLVTVASLASGLVVSAIRWAVVDTIHHRTAVRRPNWDFGKLSDRLAGFLAIVENHYRYYQFYSAMFIAVPFAAIARAASSAGGDGSSAWLGAGLLGVEAVLFFGSRDALTKYYARAEWLLGDSVRSSSEKGSGTMTNGFHHKRPVPPKASTPKQPSVERPKPKAPSRTGEK